MLKNLVRKVLHAKGVEIERRPDHVRPRRKTQLGGLLQARDLGLQIATVVDVGAGHGTDSLLQTFPRAHHVLVEPLSEFAEALRKLGAKYSVEVHTLAAGASEGEITLHVHPDLYGSSPFLEEDIAGTNGEPRTVQQRRLDDIVDSSRGPFLLKIDTQGYELAVLDGATAILPSTAAILLEVSLLQFFSEGPDFGAVVAKLDQWNFVPYDILESNYRLLDGALAQVDILFLPRESELRKDRRYATEAQRRAQFGARGAS